MLANFLEKSKPINFIVYLVLFFCFFLTVLYSNFSSDKFTLYIVFESVSFFILFNAIFYSYRLLVSKNELTLGHSYAFFLFILGIILVLSKMFEFKTLILLLIYLILLIKIYSINSSTEVIQKIFDSGFYLGILYILEPYSLLFFIVIYASILLHQKITIRTFLIPIIGFFTPLIIYFTYVLWSNATENFSKLFYFDVINNMNIYIKDYAISVLGTVLLLTLFSVILKSPKVFSISDFFKKSWILLIINAIIATIFILMVINKNGSEIAFLLVPTSIIIANGFDVIRKKIIKEVLFWVFLLGTFAAFFLL